MSDLYQVNQEWLEAIKKGFATTIKANHVSLEWADEFQEYLNVKYHLPTNERIWFIRMFYYSIGPDLNISRIFIKNCIQAFGKKRTLDDDCGLVLDWRILYDLTENILQDKVSNTEVANNLLPFLLKLVDLASRFFDSNETMNILERIVPNMNAMSSRIYIGQLARLVYFLPVNGSLDWLPMVFRWWDWTTNSLEVNMYYLYLISRVVYTNWREPTKIQFTKENVQQMLTVVVKVFELNVGEPAIKDHAPNLFDRDVLEMDNGDFMHSGDVPECFFTDQLQSAATIIALSLYEEEDVVSFLDPLEKLLHAIEPFCHPSNIGGWTAGIFRFLFHLSWAFLYRRNVQKGTKYQLTQNLLNKVSKLVFPLLEFGIYGKAEVSLDLSHSALRCWAWMTPDIVFPAVLPSVYSSLQNLNETHRTEASISMMSIIVNPMIRKGNYPPGKKELVRVLELALPGIDINDERKTFMTCFLFIASLCTVPIANTSGFANEYEGDEKEACQSTARFETLLESLIESLFLCFRNLPENTGAVPSKTANSLGLLCEFLFPQLSPQFEELVLQKLKPYVHSVIPHVTDAVALICGVWSSRNPKKKLEAFLSVCIKGIHEELDHGACTKKGSNPLNPSGMASISDARFHWYQEILLRMFAYSGAAILDYKNDVINVMDRMINACISVQSYTVTGSCLGNLLHALTERYPIGFSSHPLECWTNEEFLQKAHLHWGEGVHKKNLKIDWHIPSAEEVSFAWELLQRYYHRTHQELLALMQLPTNTDLEKQETYHQVSKWITLVQNCVCSTFVAVKPKQNPLPQTESYSHFFNTPTIECCWAIDENNPLYEPAHALLDSMLELLRDVTEYLQQKTPDNTEGLITTINAIEAALTFKFYSQQEVAIVKSLKPIQVAPADPSVFCRPIRISEHFTLMLKRKIYTRRQAGLSPLHMQLVCLLLRLSICSYTDVRIQAQNSLLQTITDYLYLCEPITNEIISLIANSNDDDVQKGCLYILQNAMVLEYLSLTRKLYYKVSIVLIDLRSQDVLKDSVISLIDGLLQLLLQKLDFFTDEMPIVKVLQEEAEKIQVDPAAVEIVRKRHEDALDCLKKSRIEYLDQVLKITKTDFHWSVGIYITDVLYLMIQSPNPIEPTIVEFAYRNLLNEHLQIREQSMTLLNEVFLLLKRRSKKTGHFSGSHIKRLIEPHSPDFSRIILEWNDTGRIKPFLASSHQGWFAYPRRIKLYMGFIDGPCYTDPSFRETMEIPKSYLSKYDFWNELSRLLTLELTEEEPPFNYEVTQFIATIFTVFQEEFLELIIPTIQDLIGSPSEITAHKTAAEFLCGILFGCKHWSPVKLRELFSRILPIFMEGVNCSSTESLWYWKESIAVLFGKRDPTRYLDLIALFELDLERNPLTQMHPSKVCKKLSFMNLILSGCRIPTSFYEKWLKNYFNMASSPYQEVREALASGVDFALAGLARPFDPEYSTVQQFIIRPEFQTKPCSIALEFLEYNIANNIPVLGKQFNSNIAKFILSWFHHGLASFSKSGIVPYFSKLVSYTLLISESAQADVQEMANALIRNFPKYHLPTFLISEMVKKFQQFCDLGGSWHMKSKVINIVQVFYFQHIQYLEQQDRTDILRLLLQLSRDPHLEVRNLVVNTLAGILRCSLREDIPILTTEYLKLLDQSPLPAKLKRSERTEQDNNLIIERHSIILILSGVVLAHPFEIPRWMAEVLVKLAECSTNPSPIPETIRKTFREFKRTHQDTWERQKHVFSDDELYAITDLLISPGYYA